MSDTQKIYFSDTFSRLEHTLRLRERRRGTDIPITVGILAADYNRRFCRENIINQIDRLNRKTGELLDFYIPGYEKIPLYRRSVNSFITYNGRKYRFSQSDYDAFLDALEEKGIRVTGRTQLLLVPFDSGRLWFKDALVFDLEEGEEVRRAGSAKLFFDYLIEISRETTKFEAFRATIQHDMRKHIFLEFLKEKLKDLFWSKVLPLG